MSTFTTIEATVAATEPSRLPARTPWDDRVDAWESIAASPVFLRLAAHVLELGAPQAQDTIVDLGAGTGLLALPAAELAHKVIAVDYSQPMLERLADRAAQAGLDNISCQRADLRRLDLEDETADLVVSSYAFHHLDNDAKELALAETRRILRPGGRLVICDMMFGLSLRPNDRRIIAGKLTTIARKGPAGLIRIARNAGRLATGKWEHPAPPERWQTLLEARHFADIGVNMIENEAGIATAIRPPGGIT